MKKILSFLVLFSLVVVQAQTTTKNYVKTTTYKEHSTTSITAPTVQQATQNVTYFDGLGRPVQQVAHQQSSTGKDIVTPIEYDAYGRQATDHLPYVPSTAASLDYKPTALTDVLTFYYTDKYEYAYNPFSEKQFEASPLSRVLKQAAPGNDWRKGYGHEIKLEYQTNVVSDYVKQYGVSFPTGNKENPKLEDKGVYGISELYKTITKDENWQPNQTFPYDHTTEEYKDKQGRIILKRTYNLGEQHDTYYVYDIYGNLTYVLPPKITTSQSTTQNSWIGQNYFFDNPPGLFAQEIYYYLSFDFTTNGYFNISIDGWGDVIQFNNGLVMNLDFISPALPDMEVGNIQFDNGNPAGFAYIQSGNLYINNPSGLADTSSYRISTTLSVDLSSLQSSTSSVVDQTQLDNLGYQYKYDSRNRLVEKKLPGKDWEYIVYDKLDRPILTQDANLRKDINNTPINKWLFTKYDAFGRVVYTGDYKNIIQTSRTDMQALVDTKTTFWETKQGTSSTINGSTVYYTNVAFPNINDTNINLFTINYYDDYNFDLNGANATAAYDTTITNAKGLATGSKVRILGTTNWITNVNYYDAKGRSICSYSKNDYLQTTSRVNSKLDFVGKVLETTSTQDKTGQATITIVEKFTYDPQGRLLTQTQKINSQDDELIVSNEYDELGQLIRKGVGGKTTQSRLQTVDYTYNVRGWLKGINDVNAIGTDLFAFKINYNNPTDLTKALFNGNISQTYWKTANNDPGLKNYTYSYDALNRLTLAESQDAGRYNESMGYDKNGNIMSLIRTGNTDANGSTFGTMDNLVYSYNNSNTGNKLMSVGDSSGITEGFKDGNTVGDDYSYDDNGNMTKDLNKGITTAISYNHLNLPIQITFATGNIQYAYDATGVKQRKIVSTGTTTDYAAGFIYEKIGTGADVLKFFSHPEGYVVNNSGTFDYIYQYKDHLGNVRLSYDKNLAIVEENNYYPFGLRQKGYNNTPNYLYGNPQAERYKYNGKELQDELGLNLYDYGARNYMPDIGRWGSIDNKSEKYVSLSPYHYAGNNPILYLDIDGNEFTEDAWKWVNRLIADINSRQEKNNNSIADYKAKIAEGGSDRQIARWNRNINSLTATNAELETTRGETATLAASSQVYDVVTNSGGTERDALGNSTTTNQTTFNSDNNRVQLTVSSGTDLGLFSHELKHMYQFETGETTLGLTKNNGGISLKGNNLLFYDLSDEVQAYQRGALFGQRENINSTSDVLAKGIYSDKIPTGPINAVNHPNAAGIKQNPQSFANKYNAAFRIGTTTYKPQ